MFIQRIILIVMPIVITVIPFMDTQDFIIMNMIKEITKEIIKEDQAILR